MKRWMLMTLLACTLAACGGDDDGATRVPDASVPTSDAGPDAGSATFTDFVIDLVEHKTADDSDPVTVDFGLPDPDQDNPAAYQRLFP
jgi:hypothetical protein